jgi:hypothetical protein
MQKYKHIHKYVLAVFLFCTSFVFAHAVQAQTSSPDYSKCREILSKANNNGSKENFKSSGFSNDSFVFEAEEAEELEETENTEGGNVPKAKIISHQFLFCYKISVLNLEFSLKYRHKVFSPHNSSHFQLKNIKLLL